jgi:Xaa-Pro aminopeptidase
MMQIRGEMMTFRSAMLAGIAATFLTAAASAATPPVLPLSDTEQSEPQLLPILSMRDRAKIENEILADRLETVIPSLMRSQGIDMWVLVAREYFEDPVVATMLNAESLHARRRTILVFFDPGEGKPIERLTVSRYGLGGLFKPVWDPDKQPNQWARLSQLIAELKPHKIAVNRSSLSAFADGMTDSQYKEMSEAIRQVDRPRIVSGEGLAIGWLETRTPKEMAIYPGIARIAHAIIAEAFSRKVITPGKTTADDVMWWYRQRLTELGLGTWFHPSIAVMRQGAADWQEGDTVIQPGDLIWTDFGITYLRLNTDMQHLAYVLKPGETEAPAGLRAGLKAANGVQDALLASYALDATGNQVLAKARATAIANGLEPSIYSHPLGYHGHAAGPAIGFWDNQKGEEHGTFAVHANTTWSIELSATQAVPEWGGQKVAFRAEENAFFDGKTVRFLDGRQTEIRLIP